MEGSQDEEGVAFAEEIVKSNQLLDRSLPQAARLDWCLELV